MTWLMLRVEAVLARVAVLAFAFLSVACRHDWHKAEEFAYAVQCGMTAREVRDLAARFGVDSRNLCWQRSDTPRVLTVKQHTLDFVDIQFQGGQAVAVQRGNYVAFTTGVEYRRTRMLCRRGSNVEPIGCTGAGERR